MPDHMAVPGLISDDERRFLVAQAEMAVEAFGPRCTVVNVGVHRGASCYCLRAGAPEARLVGVDLANWVWGSAEDLAWLNMELFVGDSRIMCYAWRRPIHAIFVDGDHAEAVVRADIRNWVLPRVVPGGFASFHDACYGRQSEHHWISLQVGAALAELGEGWIEREGAGSIRWFERNG